MLEAAAWFTLLLEFDWYHAGNCFEIDSNFCSKMILVSVLILVCVLLMKTNSHLLYFFLQFS